MGYRSDVAYTIRFVDDHDTNNEQSFYTFLAEAKSNPRCQIALSEVVIDAKKQMFFFSASDVKWYESYPDVMSHMALVEQAEDWIDQCHKQALHCKIGVVFLRVGEDSSDIEERAHGDYGYHWIQVRREIHTDW